MDPAADFVRDPATSEITLIDLWRVVWGGRFVIIGITGFFTVIAIVYALLATEWYRAGSFLAAVDAANSGGVATSVSPW